MGRRTGTPGNRRFGADVLSDNPNVRLSLKTINDELARLGLSVVLTKGDGYFYFQGGEAADWLERIVRVPTLRRFTLDQWIGEYKALQEKNKALVKGTPVRTSRRRA